MNLNVFNWIRDGVRQSVLLGFSDAIEQVGTPDNGEELSPVMQELIATTGTSAGRKRISGGKGAAGRKRLGRSLKELGDDEKK